MKKTILLLAVSLTVALNISHSANASKLCTQGPDCEKLNQLVETIKTLKEKRHEDVKTFGRKSSQVQSYDQELKAAVQEDANLRQERDEAKKPKGHHRKKLSKLTKKNHFGPTKSSQIPIELFS